VRYDVRSDLVVVGVGLLRLKILAAALTLAVHVIDNPTLFVDSFEVFHFLLRTDVRSLPQGAYAMDGGPE
jgi:hypothetical protein